MAKVQTLREQVNSLVSDGTKRLNAGDYEAAHEIFTRAISRNLDPFPNFKYEELHVRIAKLWESVKVKTDYSYERAGEQYQAAGRLRNVQDRRGLLVKAGQNYGAASRAARPGEEQDRLAIMASEAYEVAALNGSSHEAFFLLLLTNKLTNEESKLIEKAKQLRLQVVHRKVGVLSRDDVLQSGFTRHYAE